MHPLNLKSVKNVRDLGDTLLTNGSHVKCGLFYRGACLDNANFKDLSVLFDQHSILTVIDLRCNWERSERAKNGSLLSQDHPQVQYLHIPLFDKDIVGVEYANPAPDTHPVGNDFACDPKDLYRALANPLTSKQLSKVVHVIFDEAVKEHPVFFHCSGGKDRAGIVSFLLLNILGADNDAIIADYLETNTSRDADYDAMLVRFLRFTDDPELAHQLVLSHRANVENLHIYVQTLSELYGSLNGFIKDILLIDNEYLSTVKNHCTIS